MSGAPTKLLHVDNVLLAVELSLSAEDKLDRDQRKVRWEAQQADLTADMQVRYTQGTDQNSIESSRVMTENPYTHDSIL